MKGFSLVEVIIAGGLSLIVGLVLLSVLSSSNNTFYKENAVVSEGVGLNQAVDQIDSYIRQATYVAPGFPQSAPTNLSGDQILVLELPALTSTRTLAGVYDYVLVSADSGNPKVLRLQIFPDSRSTRRAQDLVLTTILDGIHFTYLDKTGAIVSPVLAAQVGVDLELLASSGTKINSERTSSTVVSLRNQ